MTRKTQWNSDALPYDQTLDQVLYDIRCADAGESLLLDAVSVQDIIEDSDGALAFDALVTPFAKLERKMEVLNGVMERTGQAVKPVSMQITDPFKQRGVANVAVIFELSDGQTVSIFFHNPDVTPNKMASTDELISWKWLLNKKDITIVVAPERGQDLNVREVARRIMKLAEKNSPAFQRANGKRTETMQRIGGLKEEIGGLEKELASAQRELEVAKVEAETAAAEVAQASRNANATGSVEEAVAAYEQGEIDFSAGKTRFPPQDMSNDQKRQWLRGWDAANIAAPVPDPSVEAEANVATVGADVTAEIDPTSPEGYAQVMAEEALQLKWQDRLDDFFQGRIVDVRNALRKLGWDDDGSKPMQSGPLKKGEYELSPLFKHVGAGRNVVGINYEIKGITGFFMSDSLTRTAKEMAERINMGIPASLSTPVADLTYHDDGMFTTFLPNTKAGEDAWHVMAENDGTGKVLTIHAAGVISQLRDKGYTVAERPATSMSDIADDDLLAELTQKADEQAEISGPEQAASTGSSGVVNYYDASDYVVEHFLGKKQADAMVFSMIDGGKLIQAKAAKDTKAGIPRITEQMSAEASAQNPGSDVSVFVFRSGDSDTAAKFLEAKGFTIDYTPKQVQEVAAEDEDNPASEQLLIDAYIKAWGTEAEKTNTAVAAVNWDEITDKASADAEYMNLTQAVRAINSITPARDALEAIGIKTWDTRLSGLTDTPEFAAHSTAMDAYKVVRDKIQEIAKEKLIESGIAELAALPSDAPLEDFARAIYKKHGIDVSDRSDWVLRVVTAVNEKNAEALRSILAGVGSDSNKASMEIFERAAGFKLAKTQKERAKQIDEWAGITPEQRAEKESGKDAARQARRTEENVKDAWGWVKNMNVRDGSDVIDGQQYLLRKFGEGYDETTSYKKGVATVYGMKKGSYSTSVKNKSFNAFLKAAMAFGGLRKALELVGAAIPEEKVELTGKELGDFPDTPEGKKALREAAVGYYDRELIGGGGVLNIALGKLVEFDAEGRNKIESFSADPRKLHMIHAMRSIVANGKPTLISPMQPHIKAARKGVKLVHVLKTPVTINGESITARFLVYEKEDGHLFYDHSVDNSDGKAALGGNAVALDAAGAADLNLSALLPNEPSLGQRCNDSIGEETADFNEDYPMVDENEIGETFEADEITLDSASGGRMVFNLFIDGEEPEVVEEDDGEGDLAPDSPEQSVETRQATEQQGREAFQTLRPFMSQGQKMAVLKGMDGEEKQFFFDKVVEMAGIISAMPKTYEQDGMGDAAIAHLHYFKGGADWYITEKDMEAEQLQAFGLADIGYGGELGYISIVELAESGVELDFHWKPKTIAEINGKKEISETEKTGAELAAENDRLYQESVSAFEIGAAAFKAGGDGNASQNEEFKQFLAKYPEMGNGKRLRELGQAFRNGYEAAQREGEQQAKDESAPLPSPVVIAPASTEAPAEDPQMTADRTLFQSIIDNTVPDILDASYIDQLEAAYMRHIGNAEMEALFVSAVNAYTAAELAASATI